VWRQNFLIERSEGKELGRQIMGRRSCAKAARSVKQCEEQSKVLGLMRRKRTLKASDGLNFIKREKRREELCSQHRPVQPLARPLKKAAPSSPRWSQRGLGVGPIRVQSVELKNKLPYKCLLPLCSKCPAGVVRVASQSPVNASPRLYHPVEQLYVSIAGS
jgi:hypothetical protein